MSSSPEAQASPEMPKPSALTENEVSNFNTIQLASANQDLALLRTRLRSTGDEVAVIVAVNASEAGYQFVPLAKLLSVDELNDLLPPSGGAAVQEKPAPKLILPPGMH